MLRVEKWLRLSHEETGLNVLSSFGSSPCLRQCCWYFSWLAKRVCAVERCGCRKRIAREVPVMAQKKMKTVSLGSSSLATSEREHARETDLL